MFSAHAARTPSQVITVRLPARHTGQRRMWNAIRNHRFSVEPCGRGFGKSDESVREMADDALARLQCNYGAPDYKRVEEVYNRLRKALAPALSRYVYARRLELITGGSIEFWTLNDRTAGQSRHPDRWIIDEFGLVPHLRAIVEESIIPSLASRKGHLRLRGTPKGHNDAYHFWRMAQEDSEWATFTATSYDNPLIDPAELDRSRGRMTEDRFNQEILAQFLEDGAGVFRHVKRAVYGPMLTLAELSDAPGHYVIGADLGKINDYTVFAVLNLDTGRIVHLWRMQGDYSVQLPRLKALAEACRAQAVIIESNIEQMFTEQARKLDLPVLSFNTNASTKQPLIERLALAFEQETISIPDDMTLTSELMAYESERRADGRMSYSAPEGQHDDTVMAVALAWYGKRSTREWGDRSAYE